MVTRTIYRLTDKVHEDYPEAIKQLSKGHAYDMSTNIFERLPQIFFEEKPDNCDYVRFLGREKNKRVYKYVLRSYINQVGILDKYKVLVPEGNGSGKFGEIISFPVLADPGTGSTETFLSIGGFETKDEASNVLNYIKTKFCRALLGGAKDNATYNASCLALRSPPRLHCCLRHRLDETNPRDRSPALREVRAR